MVNGHRLQRGKGPKRQSRGSNRRRTHRSLMGTSAPTRKRRAQELLTK